MGADDPRPSRAAQRGKLDPQRDGEWFRLLVEGVRDYAILGLDVDGRVTSWNKGAEHIKGYTAKEIIGRHYSAFYPEDDIRAGVPARQLETAAVDGRIEASGWRIRKDGSRFWAVVVITALFDETGQLKGFGKVTRDVTEHKAQREALERQAGELAAARDEALEARHAAEAATFAKSSFLATMSHEIRTPMNGVVGMIELLLDTYLTAEQREYAQTVQTSAESLLHIIGEILDVSRIEAGRMEMAVQDFDLYQLALDCVQLLRSSAQAKDLDLLVECEEESAYASADAGRTRQVLVNLIGNAIKFTDHGDVIITIRGSQSPDMTEISVADTGVGIPPDVLPRLFDAFEQGNLTTTQTYGGSGLGLAISKQLVELMGGTISVSSTPDVGSAFSFSLPTAPAPHGPGLTAAFASKRERLADDAETPPRGAGRILVVDDNPVNQLVAASTLEKHGYSVDLAVNGQEAIEKHAERVYCAIIMDCQMPVINGYDATRAIRSTEGAHRHTPIIGLTAGAHPEDKQRSLDSGMDEYLAKPVKSALLIQAVAQCIDRPIANSRSEPFWDVKEALGDSART